MVEKHPVIGMGKTRSLPFQVSAACWIDLLGYGRAIAKADFNPMHSDAAAALRRIRNFHGLVAQHSAKTFPTLVINDGAAAYRDLSLRQRNVTFDFVARCWKLFQAINMSEGIMDQPGCRAVVAAGFRARGSGRGKDHLAGQFASILERLAHGVISPDQALHEAASMPRTFDIVPQLQLNFAFTKAYVAEQSGSGGGLTGPNFFVDASLFQHAPEWLIIDETISWKKPELRLSADFYRVSSLRVRGHPEGGATEVRDALQVAAAIAPNSSMMDAIREVQRSRRDLKG
jgi:hypothetical protein